MKIHCSCGSTLYFKDKDYEKFDVKDLIRVVYAFLQVHMHCPKEKD